MIKKLKRAAEWMGLEIACENEHRIEVKHYVMVCGTRFEDGSVLFHPDHETGRHWLVEMERKLTPKQWRKYEISMYSYFLEDINPYDFDRWFKTAESKLCFEKIMEVVG